MRAEVKVNNKFLQMQVPGGALRKNSIIYCAVNTTGILNEDSLTFYMNALVRGDAGKSYRRRLPPPSGCSWSGQQVDGADMLTFANQVTGSNLLSK